MRAKLPGHGYSPPYSPPYGRRREEDEEGTPDGPTRWHPSFADPQPPTALWGSLIKSGYGVVYADTYDGIPFIFGERPLWTTRGLEAGRNNADDVTVSYSLVIAEGDHMSQECNREEGLASGRALDMVFGRQQLADEGLGALLFKRPSLKCTLTIAVTDPNADTFEVDSTTGWDESGIFYIGRECVKYAAISATAFLGCERGVAGMPHYHTASTASAYRQITDVPIYWRGRLFTRWAHLVSPEGRFLGERWCELGEWCRQDWRGYVRDTPRPTAAGMVLTCLPIIRIAGQEFGAEVSGKLARDDLQPPGLNHPYIVADPTDQVELSQLASAGDYALVPEWPTITPLNPPEAGGPGIFSINTWSLIAAYDATQAFTDGVSFVPREGHLEVRVVEPMPVDPGPHTVVDARAWFLEPGVVPGTRISPEADSGGYIFRIQWAWTGSRGLYATGWLVVTLDPSVDYTDAEIGETGLLALEIDGVTEIASYDRTLTSTVDSTMTAFRITARNVLNTGQVNPWAGETKIKVVAGATGRWGECLATLLTSSGTGDRGPLDILPHGFGLGLPASWIASSSTSHIDTVQTVIGGPLSAVTAGKTSLKDLLCGWAAAIGACLVQRRNGAGEIVIDTAPTGLDDDPAAEALAAADILLDGVESPEMMEAPNHVRFVTSDLLTERPAHVVRDAVRAQHEGVRSLEIKAPGMTGADARKFGAELMLLSDGQAAVRMRLAPWVEIEIGDLRSLTAAHPAVWDWSTGSYAPSTVMARVVALERWFWDQTQAVTLLLAGHAQERIYLCPSAEVIHVAGPVTGSDTVHVAAGDSEGFTAGDAVIVYERGNEFATWNQMEIESVTAGVDYDVIVFVSGLPSPIGSDIVITYDEYDRCTAVQQRFMFAQADKGWR